MEPFRAGLFREGNESIKTNHQNKIMNTDCDLITGSKLTPMPAALESPPVRVDMSDVRIAGGPVSSLGSLPRIPDARLSNDPNPGAAARQGGAPEIVYSKVN
jgi:hypothetical protein